MMVSGFALEWIEIDYERIRFLSHRVSGFALEWIEISCVLSFE